MKLLPLGYEFEGEKPTDAVELRFYLLWQWMQTSYWAPPSAPS
jgi:hypothetical protein